MIAIKWEVFDDTNALIITIQMLLWIYIAYIPYKYSSCFENGIYA